MLQSGRVPIVFYTSLCVIRGDIYPSTRPLRDVISSLPASHLIILWLMFAYPYIWVLPLHAPAIVGDGDGWLVFPLYISVRYIMGESLVPQVWLIQDHPWYPSHQVCAVIGHLFFWYGFTCYPKMIYHMVVSITPILWPLLIWPALIWITLGLISS